MFNDDDDIFGFNNPYYLAFKSESNTPQTSEIKTDSSITKSKESVNENDQALAQEQQTNLSLKSSLREAIIRLNNQIVKYHHSVDAAIAMLRHDQHQAASLLAKQNFYEPIQKMLINLNSSFEFIMSTVLANTSTSLVEKIVYENSQLSQILNLYNGACANVHKEASNWMSLHVNSAFVQLEVEDRALQQDQQTVAKTQPVIANNKKEKMALNKFKPFSIPHEDFKEKTKRCKSITIYSDALLKDVVEVRKFKKGK